MVSLEPEPSDDLAAQLGEWASLIREIAVLAARIGSSNAEGPRRGSPFAAEVDELRKGAAMPEGVLELVTMDTLGYLSSAGRHSLAISKLLASGEVFVSLMPLIRAQLETYGRMAWFLEPADVAGERIVPQRRVARHHMDALASLCRRRYSASRRSDSRGKVTEIKRDRDAVRDQTLRLFPDANLDWAEPGDEKEWRCGDDPYVGLGDGAVAFHRVVLADAKGHYDALSDFAHPSIITNRQMTRPTERDGYISYDWHVEPADVARQVWNCGAMHAQTCRLVASWLGVPVIDQLDEFVGRLGSSTGVSS